MGVLCTLNVTPTQLHTNSWASLRAFRVLAEIFGLRPFPHVFLHFYRARTSHLTKWTSLVSQSGAALFTPFCSSYKYFKNAFFKLTITPNGRHYFFNGDVPKFPLYWMRDPVAYLSWPRSPMTEDDKQMFGILDQFPRHLPIRDILKLFLTSRHWVHLKGMLFNFVIVG